MNEKYAALRIFVKFGRAVALAAALFVLAVASAIISSSGQSALWFVAGVLLSAAVGGGILLLHDLVRVIADTLIPEP